MAEMTLAAPVKPPRRLHFEWLVPTLLHPRQTLAEIAAQTRGVWFAPILVLTLVALTAAVVGGSVKQASGIGGGVPVEGAMPPESYYTPEQQAQFEQAMAGTSSPVFLYVFPAILGILGVWFGWLLVSGILHLMLTLMGGRSTFGVTANIVAWGSLPLALRGLVQSIFMLVEKQPIPGPGLSGFISPVGGTLLIIVGQMLALIDLYLIWQIILLVIGVRVSSALTRTRAWVSVLITFGVILILQALIGFAGVLLSDMTVVRPFLF